MIWQHAAPVDCSRWTELGMKHFLDECGFPWDGIKAASWGNRACVKANFNCWARRGWFGSLRNEPDFPVVVWALARQDCTKRPVAEHLPARMADTCTDLINQLSDRIVYTAATPG